MPRMIGGGLSRRERQIMDILHRLRRAGVGDVLASLPDPPTYSAVRSIMRIMEEKGYLTHVEEGKRYLFSPSESPQTAAKSALRSVLDTFFAGSIELAVKTFLTDDEAALSDEDLVSLAAMIENARSEGREADSE